MKIKCPKCGHEHFPEDSECFSCGIIFRKYEASLAEPRSIDDELYKEKIDYLDAFRQIFFFVKKESDPTFLIIRGIFLLFLLYQGIRFIFSSLDGEYVMNSFWHLVNLPFHETGHLIFRLFGRFMTSLGGSLGQLLIPIICMATFLLKTRDTFAASFCLWWLGQNFMDLAPYIDDARRLTMPLLGGNTGMDSPYGFHDWEFILKEAGLIRFDHLIASFSFNTGRLLMILSFMWSLFLLSKEYGMIKEMKYND